MTQPQPGEGRPPFQQLHDDIIPEDRPQVTAEQLVAQMRETADKLLRDNASRGDMKLINTALKELRYCFKVMAPLKNRPKVTVFGSARLPPSDPSYRVAVEYGKRMAEAGYMVITGAASGIMEAGHVGAGKENSIGINIMLPWEQHANPIIQGDAKLMNLKYFFTRKLLFVKEASAVTLFPGGFGTQDEGWEVLTLVQTGKSHIFPIVMLDAPGSDYWTRWQDYVIGVLLYRKLISAEDLALYRIANSVDEAVEEVLRFYRVYHSMRYIGRDLVLRLRKPIPEALLAGLSKDFADILVSGTFAQAPPGPIEGNEFPDLPRLRLHFNRRNMGRLRQLIDRINLEG